MARKDPVTAAATVLDHLSDSSLTILGASLADSSKTSYLRLWNQFQEYWSLRNCNPSLPIAPWHIVNYLTSLFDKGYAPSTIASHASAIGFVHKLLGFTDPMDSFIVKKCIKGVVKLGAKPDTRLSITLPILHRLVQALPKVIVRVNEQILLLAIFTTVYGLFLRMGEVCLQTGSNVVHLIQRADVTFQKVNEKLIGMSVLMHHFKHKQQSSAVSLYIKQNENHPEICPVLVVNRYLQVHTHRTGPLFQFLDGSPVSYNYVTAKLKLLLVFLGLDPNRYKPHSFRIGAATAAIQSGYSDDEVRRMGRWHSDALQNYIRLPELSL